MKNFLKIEFGEACYMSCGFVGQQSANSFSELYKMFYEKFKFIYALRYLLIIIVGFFRLCFVYSYSKDKSKKELFILTFMHGVSTLYVWQQILYTIKFGTSIK